MSMGANDPRGGAIFDPRGMVGRIYKEDHYILLHTKYESSRPCDFGEEDFFYVLPMMPPGRGLYGPRGTVGRIYKEDHYTLLHTKFEFQSSGPHSVHISYKISVHFFFTEPCSWHMVSTIKLGNKVLLMPQLTAGGV